MPEGFEAVDHEEVVREAEADLVRVGPEVEADFLELGPEEGEVEAEAKVRDEANRPRKVQQKISEKLKKIGQRFFCRTSLPPTSTI